MGKEAPKILKILQHSRKVLHTPAEEIREIELEKIQRLIADLKETLKNTQDGIGLAAPQVGASLRLFIISEEAKEFRPQNIKEKEEKRLKENVRYLVFINPQITKMSKEKEEMMEGCLSVPSLCGVVARSKKVIIQAFDERGKKFIRGASGFFARVIQHEYDHLQGILFTKRAKKIMKAEKYSPNV